MIALCWWYAADLEAGHITRTPAEVDAVLDTLAGMSREDWPVLAEVTQADVDDIRAPMLGVGLHVDRYLDYAVSTTVYRVNAEFGWI